MSVAHAPELVSVWTENGAPVSLVWRGARYLVTDTLTSLYEPFIHDALTHPASKIVGWRFQGTNVSDGETRVFDVRTISAGRWELAAVYD